MHVPTKFLSFLSVYSNLSDAKIAASLFLSCGLETYHERLEHLQPVGITVAK